MELDTLTWTDVRDLGVLGKGWTDTDRFYDRFPARAKATIPSEAWDRSRNASGLRLHFVTDSPVIAADWTLFGETVIPERMPPIGASGLDLYFRHNGAWRWIAAGFPDSPTHNRSFLLQDMMPGAHEYLLYLPLVDSVGRMHIGLAPDAKLDSPAPSPGKPILFYGTSIVHGCCASRPGMSYPAILGRRLDRPFINLGLAGKGRMEPEVAGLLAELDPCVYVLDALPNLNAAEVAERTEPFVHILRRARPETPIVLVENITYQEGPFVSSREKLYTSNNEEYRKAYEALLAAGVKGLHCVPGGHLLGDDGEATVDGVHPTDVGFLRIADALEPVLKSLLSDVPPA